jgi:HK97 family phage portal protein
MALTDLILRAFKSTQPAGQPPSSGVQVYTGTVSDTGQHITPLAALSCITVNACVQAIATELAKLPWSVFAENDSGRTLLKAHPVHRVLRHEANPEMSALTWRELMLTSACLTGNGFSYIERGSDGRPTGLYFLRPDCMNVTKLPTGEVVYIYSGGTDERGRAVFSSFDIFHLMWLSPDGLLGYSPISMARQAIGLSLAAEAFGASYWRNASRPSGILSTENQLSPEAIQRMRESWEARMRGVQSAGAIAVLENGLKYQQISLSPQDSQWLEGRAFQREEICAMYRVPPSVIGVGDKQSYASAEQANREWVTNCLSSWAARLESEAQRKLIRRDEQVITEISFDTMLRADLMTRYRAYSIARQFGFMSVNEIRADMNRPSLGEEGDIYLQPSNMVPTSNAFGGENLAPDQGSKVPFTDPDAVPDEKREQAVEDIDLKPTDAMARNAQRGLDLRKEFKRGGTPVGVARARDIANKATLSPDTVGRMVSYFARHEVDKKGKGFNSGEDGYPSAGLIAWLLWGGDSGKSWANAKWEQIKRARGEG